MSDPKSEHPFFPGYRAKEILYGSVSYEMAPYELRSMYRDAAAYGEPIVIAMERYIVTRLTQQSQDTQSLEVIGMDYAVRSLLELKATFIMQGPGDVKPLFPKKTLHEILDLRQPDGGMNSHMVDALGHACLAGHKVISGKVDLP